MQRTCVKCGHTNPQATGTSDEACPQCGAIYSKASATAARPAERASGFGHQAGRPSGFGRTSILEEPPPRQVDDHRAYVQDMRARSLYPTVRAFVNLGFYFGLAIAALVVIGGAFGAFSTGGVFKLLVALGIAAVILFFTMAWREISLMLADLSDAAVRMAARGERGV